MTVSVRGGARRVARSGLGTVLVVCTGNVCRSPYLAARLRASLPGLVVISAGTGALVGRPPTDEVRELLRRHGGSTELPVARLLSADLVRAADLVLTAERRHRVAVTRLVPSAAVRTFTIKELARILPEVSAGYGTAQVVALAAAIAEQEIVDHDDDLADPYRRGPDAYDAMAAELDQALAVLVPALREPPP